MAHGANWTFIAWGLMYFTLIAVERRTDFEKKSSELINPDLVIVFYHSGMFTLNGDRSAMWEFDK